MATWKTVTFDDNGGSGGESRTLYLYWIGATSGNNFYYTSKDTSGTRVTEVESIPTRAGFSFGGYKVTTSSSNVITVANKSGRLTSSSGLESTNTAKASWTRIYYTCDIYKSGTKVGAIYYGIEAAKWFTDADLTQEYTSSNPITVTRDVGTRFLGAGELYMGNFDIQYVNSDGTPTDELLALVPTDDLTIYALFATVSFPVTVNHSGGTPTSTVFYAKNGETGTGRFYSDEFCTTSISGITPPVKTCYSWEGAFNSSTHSDSTKLINSDGTFTSVLYGLRITAAKTISNANTWTRVSYQITLSGNSWTFSQKYYYIDATNGGVYADHLCETAELTSLPIPVRSKYRFLGIYSANSTTSPGTLYVDSTGVIQQALKDLRETKTVYAIGRAAKYTLTLEPNGGTSGSVTIYYDNTSGDEAFFSAQSAVITTVTLPTYTGNAFLGYFTEASSGTQVIAANGSILSSWVPTANATVYAQWGIDVSIITVVASGATTAGTTKFWYRGSTQKFYSDSELTAEITAITPPAKRLFNLNGIYTEDGVLAVDSSGVIQSGFRPTEEFVDLTATFTRFAYEIRLNMSGGTATPAALYRAPGTSAYYGEIGLVTPVTSITVANRAGYTFAGCQHGSTTVISAAGVIQSAAQIDDDYAADAKWTAKTYTLTFNGNGATPSSASKTVTYGSAVGTLPTVQISGRTFEAWQIDGSDVTAATVWAFDSAKTAVAKWKDFFGDPNDFFNLAGNLLMLVGSESGEGRRVTNLWNGAVEQGDALLNPVCTYRVKAAGNVTVTLGTAFAAGYFITGAEYRTGADREPLLVVSGTANEGEDAINAYAATFAVDPDHVAQDPFGAVSGGGELVEMTSSAICDPVVPYENNRPCASDVVHGRKRVAGRTAAYFGESAPTFLDSFTDSGAPVSESDADYTTYAFAAERAI